MYPSPLDGSAHGDDRDVKSSNTTWEGVVRAMGKLVVDRKRVRRLCSMLGIGDLEGETEANAG